MVRKIEKVGRGQTLGICRSRIVGSDLIEGGSLCFTHTHPPTRRYARWSIRDTLPSHHILLHPVRSAPLHSASTSITLRRRINHGRKWLRARRLILQKNEQSQNNKRHFGGLLCKMVRKHLAQMLAPDKLMPISGLLTRKQFLR